MLILGLLGSVAGCQRFHTYTLRPVRSTPPPAPLPPPTAVQPDQPRAVASLPFVACAENLRYQEKTFDDWCTRLETELEPKSRIEAINALLAFGVNGYGKETAQTLGKAALTFKDISGRCG